MALKTATIADTDAMKSMGHSRHARDQCQIRAIVLAHVVHNDCLTSELEERTL